jgi:hypothetical protein
MVSGPPCQQCGLALRWFPQQNVWGCDRCRQTFPPQMVAQPQQMPPPQAAQMPWQPQQAQQPQRPMPGGGSKNVLVIGGIVVVAAIVVIAVVASRGGSKSIDGPEAVLEQLESSRDDICACKDEQCRRDVLARMDAARRADTSGKKMTREQLKKVDAIFKEIGKCIPGSRNASDEGGGDDDVTSTLEQAREDMCNCLSPSCAEAQASKLLKWMKAHKSAIDGLPDDVRNKALAIMKEHKQCHDRIMKDE